MNGTDEYFKMPSIPARAVISRPQGGLTVVREQQGQSQGCGGRKSPDAVPSAESMAKFFRLLKREGRRSGGKTTCLLSIFVSATRPRLTGPDRSGRCLLFLSHFWLRSVKRRRAELYLIVLDVVDCIPEVWTTWYQM